MKRVKVIFGTMAVLVIVTVALFNVNLKSHSKNLSALSLANIEMLAYGENDGGFNPPWEWLFNGLTKDEYGQWGNCTVTTGWSWIVTSTNTYTGQKRYCYDGGTENCNESDCIAN
jgi:hypothetical protein